MPNIQETNRVLADKILADTRQNPHAYPGRYIGIANGSIVVVTDDLDELDRQLDAVEPDASRVLIVEPTLDVNAVHQIWGLS